VDVDVDVDEKEPVQSRQSRQSPETCEDRLRASKFASRDPPPLVPVGFTPKIFTKTLRRPVTLPVCMISLRSTLSGGIRSFD
jgi:hypothetical protein